MEGAYSNVLSQNRMVVTYASVKIWAPWNLEIEPIPVIGAPK
jgi:hypothetical protein